MKHQTRTRLKGLKKWMWDRNLSGFFTINGEYLTDAQVRKMVDWAISKGYEYDTDIPDEELIELLNLNNEKQ